MKFSIALMMLVGLGVANAAIPKKFSKEGGPNDVRGAWYGLNDGSVFIQTGDAYNTAYQNSDTEDGEYQSYECTGKGTYKAIVKASYYYGDGSDPEFTTYCEVGKIDLKTGIYEWAYSKAGCPTKYTDKAIRAGPAGARCSLQCT